MVALNIYAQQGNRSVHLREIYQLGEKEHQAFVQVGEVAADSKGSVFVTDRFQYSIKKFNSRGVFQKEFGKRGKKTGEFRAVPYNIDCMHDTVAVVEVGTERVQFFSDDLQPIGEMTTAGPVADMAYNNSGCIFASVIPLSGRKEDVVMLYDKRGKIVSKVPLSDVTGQPAMDMILLCTDLKDRLIVAYQYRNRIEIYSENIQMIHQFSVSGLPKQAGVNTMYVEKLGALPEGKLILDLSTDSAGHIFILGGDYSTHPNQDVYVYDYDGNPLTTFILPEQSGILYIDKQGFLYTREKHRRVIKKYAITRVNF